MGDGFTEQIDPHAFDDQLGGDVRALIDHDTRLVLGRTCAGTLTLRVDEHGLWGSIAVNEGGSGRAQPVCPCAARRREPMLHRF